MKTGISFGIVVGIWALFFVIIEAISVFLIESLQSEKDNDTMRFFDARKYNNNFKKYGNHKFEVQGKQAADYKMVDTNQDDSDNFDRTMRYSTPIQNK